MKDIIISTLKSKLPNLQAIYLFGSQAQGTQNKDSDIDIAYLSNTKLSDYQRFDLAQEIAIKLNKDVDLVDLKNTDDIFRFQVISTGQKIYQSDYQTIANFEMKTRGIYYDLQITRKPILDRIQKSGKIYA